MIGVSDVFPSTETLGISKTELSQHWDVLTAFLKGEVAASAGETTADLRDLEPALLQFWIDTMRECFVDHYEQVFRQTADIADLSDSICAVHTEFNEPLAMLGFTDRSRESFRRAFCAALQNILDIPRIMGMLHDFLLLHSLTAPEALEVTRRLIFVGLDSDCLQVVAEVLPLEVHSYIKGHFEGRWFEEVREKCVHWAETTLLPIVVAMVGHDTTIAGQLVGFCFETLAQVRSSELFDMVRAFPKSVPGLTDLKHSMVTPNLRRLAISQFHLQCTHRLLNNSVSTADILLFYLWCIKAFSVLDPRGVLLDVVSKPIYRYLKDRPDTVAIFVDGVLGKKGSPLSFLSTDLAPPDLYSTADDDYFAIDWQPDPVDAPADFVKRQTADAVTTLLALYDNKEVFIKQLTTVVGDKLLSQASDGEIDAIAKCAEQLKKRFGEKSLQHIDVMIADVGQSKLFNTQMSDSGLQLGGLSLLVLSRLYWPNIHTGSIQLPRSIESGLSEIVAAYPSVSQGRKLELLPNLGFVSLTIELEDRKLSVTATPLQAAVLNAFDSEQDSPERTLEQVTELVGSSKEDASSALKFWLQNEVLGLKDNKYFVLENKKLVEEAAESGQALHTTESRDPGLEEMAKYWSYIVGMLTNLGNLPIEKIQSFLVMLVPKEDPYVKTKNELENYLYHMADEGKVNIVEGNFSLP